MKQFLFLNLNNFIHLPIVEQLFYVIKTIYKSIKENKNIIIVELELHEKLHTMTTIMDMLNVEKLKDILKENYNIYLFFHNSINFNLLSIKYSNMDKTIDFTDFIYLHYYSKNILLIKNYSNVFHSNSLTNINLLDKETNGNILVQYLLNENEFIDTYKINIGDNKKIYYNFKNVSSLSFKNYDLIPDKELFYNIYLKLPFNNNIINDLEKIFVDNFSVHEKINVIDLSFLYNIDLNNVIMESGNNETKDPTNDINEIIKEIVNKIEKKDNYIKLIERKYINTIEDQINIKDNNILIINNNVNYSNPNKNYINNTNCSNVISYLKENNYKFYYNKLDDEYSTLLHFLLICYNNNKFIGCFHNQFNYNINLLINKKKLKICIDTNNNNNNYNYSTF